MPAPGCDRPCGRHRRLCAADSAGNHAVSIHASVHRLPDIRFDPPQRRSGHGYDPCRGRLFGLFPPAAAGDHARGCGASHDSASPDIRTRRPSTADRRLSVGIGVSDVVNADLVLSTAEAGYRSSQLASCSCARTLVPPASEFLVGMRKSRRHVPRNTALHVKIRLVTISILTNYPTHPHAS